MHLSLCIGVLFCVCVLTGGLMAANSHILHWRLASHPEPSHCQSHWTLPQRWQQHIFVTIHIAHQLIHVSITPQVWLQHRSLELPDHVLIRVHNCHTGRAGTGTAQGLHKMCSQAATESCWVGPGSSQIHTVARTPRHTEVSAESSSGSGGQ